MAGKTLSKTAVLLYSALGHAYFHMFTAFYFTIVLALAVEWQRPYGELVELWTPAALLVGLFSLVAGWLGDRWSARGMLVVYFFGMGASSIAAGFAQSPAMLLSALCGIGIFAAIYHPIGIPMVIRNSSTNRGKALALNGVFGSLGTAFAGAVSGVLVAIGGSFLAFVLPGVVVLLTGAVMLIGLRGRFERAQGEASEAETQGKRGKGGGNGGDSGSGSGSKPLVILLFCLTAAGIIYHATQTGMPKLLEIRLFPGALADIKTVGFYVALAYGIAGLFQFVGGALADRYDLKTVYLCHSLGLALMLAAAAVLNQFLLVAVLVAVVSFGASVLPAENMLLARFTPSKHYGLAFGLKFVLFFGSGAPGVMLVSAVHRQTGELQWLFWWLAITAVIICVAALALPRGSVPPSAPRKVGGKFAKSRMGKAGPGLAVGASAPLRP